MNAVNEFRYEEIQVGMTQEFTVAVTKKQQDMFREMSGDINPLHRDGEYAAGKGYDGCVVFGMLTASFYSTLAGVYLPGKHCLLHGVDAKFLKPVFPGDTLRVEGKVTEKNDTFRLLTIKAVIRNQRGEKVSRATIQAGVTD